ncbi:hypothetical protein G210_4369 [Candida maltosa Xu316]|uniref:SWIM-type domain-containing protein n=1 Tax=Candida maltosa (strain Xu316) TaxID=1245528 RepID=M3J0S8_CANMX|nr:hypothetical protein G210_4369 [Candida maltosa Xu316]
MDNVRIPTDFNTSLKDVILMAAKQAKNNRATDPRGIYIVPNKQPKPLPTEVQVLIGKFFQDYLKALPDKHELGTLFVERVFQTEVEYRDFMEERMKGCIWVRHRQFVPKKLTHKYVFYEEYRCDLAGSNDIVANQNNGKCGCQAKIITTKQHTNNGEALSKPYISRWYWKHNSHELGDCFSVIYTKKFSELIMNLMRLKLRQQVVVEQITEYYEQFIDKLSPIERENIERICFLKWEQLSTYIIRNITTQVSTELFRKGETARLSAIKWVEDANESGGFAQFRDDYHFKTPQGTQAWSIVVITQGQFDILKQLELARQVGHPVLMAGLEAAHCIGLDFDKRHPTHLFVVTYQNKDTKRGIPLAYLLTNSLDKGCLDNLLSIMKNGFSFYPSHFVTDCDEDEINCVRENFPGVQIELYRYYLVTALRSKLRYLINEKDMAKKTKTIRDLEWKFGKLLGSAHYLDAVQLYESFKQEWDIKYPEFSKYFADEWESLCRYWYHRSDPAIVVMGETQCLTSFTAERPRCVTMSNGSVDMILYLIFEKFDRVYSNPHYYGLFEIGLPHGFRNGKVERDDAKTHARKLTTSTMNSYVSLCDDNLLVWNEARIYTNPFNKLLCACLTPPFFNCIHLVIIEKYIKCVFEIMSDSLDEMPDSGKWQYVLNKSISKLGTDVGTHIATRVQKVLGLNQDGTVSQNPARIRDMPPIPSLLLRDKDNSSSGTNTEMLETDESDGSIDEEDFTDDDGATHEVADISEDSDVIEVAYASGQDDTGDNGDIIDAPDVNDDADIIEISDSGDNDDTDESDNQLLEEHDKLLGDLYRLREKYQTYRGEISNTITMIHNKIKRHSPSKKSKINKIKKPRLKIDERIGLNKIPDLDPFSKLTAPVERPSNSPSKR